MHEPIDEERRLAAARAALAQMKGGRGWIGGVDDTSLRFLADEVSAPLLGEMVKLWTASGRPSPTSAAIAEMAEGAYLKAAVGALDGR